ncbi:MAG: nucleotide sugar dehydrogenase [Oligoflexia bacterium]|nr:nucleotide sugar dehydrogenase [Oligoflexia bacterium]
MSQRVLVVGAWHLGSVVGACLADAGNQVYLWDQNKSVEEKWSQGLAPIHEPGLSDLVNKHWKKDLSWTSTPEIVASKANWVIIAYDTPINEQDEVQLQTVEEGAQRAFKSLSDKTNVFVTAQVPVGTCRKFRQEILRLHPGWHGHMMYQPENLRLGEAIKSFKTPDRMVLGLDDMSQQETLAKDFQKLLGNETTPLNVMSLESAEMVKHALNSFLATCVVFANEISEICEKSGADAWDVVSSLKQDSRVGPKAFLRPGLGFAGGTLARDVKTLSKFAKKKEDINFFNDLYAINDKRNQWVVDTLKAQLGTLTHKTIVLMGVTYKPFTSTVRRSPALQIAELLAKEGAHCRAIDPMADLTELSPEERKNLPFELMKDPLAAFENTQAAVLVTEWPQFFELDWPQIHRLMSEHVLIDTKNHLAPKNILKGFHIIIPGKPTKKELL